MFLNFVLLFFNNSVSRPTLDPWIPKVVHIYNFPFKSYKIFLISLCPFIITCLGIIFT
jgi:hypothetical protein